MSNHDRYRELLAGHALSALEPEDEQVVLAHLPSCAHCMRELVAARETAAQLAYAVDPVEPPAELFAAIRAEVLTTDPDAFDVQAPVPVRGRRASDGHSDVVVPFARRHSRFETRASKLVAAAASVSIAAIVGLGAWNISLHQDNAQKGQVSAAVQEALDVIKGGGNGQAVTLTDPVDGEVRAVALMHANGSMDIVTDGLAPNDAKSSQYVVWGQTGTDAPVALGAFVVDEEQVDTVTGVQTNLVARPDRLLISKERTGLLPKDVTRPVYAAGSTSA